MRPEVWAIRLSSFDPIPGENGKPTFHAQHVDFGMRPHGTALGYATLFKTQAAANSWLDKYRPAILASLPDGHELRGLEPEEVSEFTEPQRIHALVNSDVDFLIYVDPKPHENRSMSLYDLWNKCCEARKLNPAFIAAVMQASRIESTKLGDKTTVVQLILPNGFAITDSSACVDPANYDHDLGVSIVLKRMENKVWELYGFHLQQVLAGWEPSE